MYTLYCAKPSRLERSQISSYSMATQISWGRKTSAQRLTNCSRCIKQFKSTQVRQQGQERMMNKGWWKYRGRDTVRKQAHVMVELQGVWQIANRLLYRKNYQEVALASIFPFIPRAGLPQNSKHNASALKQYTIAPYQACRSWRAFSFCSLLISSLIRPFS